MLNKKFKLEVQTGNFFGNLYILLLSIIIICSCTSQQKQKENIEFSDKLLGKKDSAKQPELTPTTFLLQDEMDVAYKNNLLATKQFYPFNSWRNSYHQGLTQYTKENCARIEKVFDDLIAALIVIGSKATEEQKKELFKKAILTTNKLNNEIEGLIETGEREDLCELTDKITTACGLDPDKYGDGEGLASEWREW